MGVPVAAPEGVPPPCLVCCLSEASVKEAMGADRAPPEPQEAEEDF